MGSSTSHSKRLMRPTSFIEIEESWPWKWTPLAITLNAVYKILEQLTDYNLYIYETCKLWGKSYALFSNFKLVKCFHVIPCKIELLIKKCNNCYYWTLYVNINKKIISIYEMSWNINDKKLPYTTLNIWKGNC